MFLNENIDEFKKLKNEIFKSEQEEQNIIFNNQKDASLISINISENKNNIILNNNNNQISSSDFKSLEINTNNILNNKNDNKINNNEISSEYKYKLLTNSNDLIKNAIIKDEYANFEIKLINDNKNCEWPPNGRTKLISDEKSDLQITSILLESKQNVQLVNICCGLACRNPGIKKCILNFNVDGKNYGEPIILTVKINEDLVQVLRDEFSLSKEDYPDEIILNALKSNNNDIYKAFGSLFNN